MRVAWIQDLNFWVQPGGAERTDREIVTEGIRRGHEIETIIPERFPPAETISCDLVVFSNIHTLMQMDKERIMKLAAQHPFVMWHHDYFCRWRLYFPMVEKCTKCIYLQPWRGLYQQSILNIWMSPLHRAAHLYVMPELTIRPYALVPSALNPDEYAYRDMDPIPNTVIGVNSLFGFKGSSAVLKYALEHQELSFTFVGGSEIESFSLPANCKFLGLKEKSELLQLYGAHEYLIHLPQNLSPSDRVPVEYLLANPKGKLIINSCIGIFSYPNVIINGKINRQELVRLVSTSPKVFWEAIEHVC